MIFFYQNVIHKVHSFCNSMICSAGKEAKNNTVLCKPLNFSDQLICEKIIKFPGETYRKLLCISLNKDEFDNGDGEK